MHVSLHLFAPVALFLSPYPALAQDALSRQVASRVGLMPEQARTLFARVDAQKRQINQLASAKGVSERTLRAVALELGARNPKLSQERFISLIAARADDAAAAQKKIAELDTTIASLDPGGRRTRAQASLSRARTAFDEGRLEEAEAAFGELAFLRSSELGPAQQAWNEAVNLQARAAALRGDTERSEAVLRDKIADIARQKDEFVRFSEQETWRSYLTIADNWSDRGARLGDISALRRAVDIYRNEALPAAPRERVPLDWAKTQNMIGTALQSLGARESGTARFEEAVAAHRRALEERTREHVPLDWAATQSDLGNALSALGRYEEAFAAFRLALKERTRERVPADWAITQNNLGTALGTLGERDIGTARLKEAVAAYRSALEVTTRKRAPLDWAGIQINLGNSLVALGVRESSTAWLKEAVAAYRSALEEWPRESVPLDWAMTQNGLGNALRNLGERESGTALLEEAVAAYRRALEEWTRERVPLDWTMATLNLARAMIGLAARQNSDQLIAEAKSMIQDARRIATEAQDASLVSYANALLESMSDKALSEILITSDPSNLMLALKQIKISFPPGITQADATKKAREFAEGMKSVHGCEAIDGVARQLGAEVIANGRIRAGDLPGPLQDAMLGLSLGETTPPFGSIEEGVRVLMLCGREFLPSSNDR